MVWPTEFDEKLGEDSLCRKLTIHTKFTQHQHVQICPHRESKTERRDSVEIRKSYTGYVFKLAGSAISWESRKQQVVALSSAEAEYVSLSEATKEAIFLRRLIKEVTGITSTVVMRTDSQSAMAIASHHTTHKRTKHIDVRHHYVRNAVQDKIIRLSYLDTKRMPADCLTKALYDAMELPGQQLSAAQALSTLDHVLNLDIKAPPGCQRLTGIIATMGKSTNDIEIMESLMGAGMNVALLNLSFGSKEEHIETIKMLRQAAKNFSAKMGRNFPLGIAATMPGRKIRTGKIADSYGGTVELKSGEVVRLTTDETYRERCSTYTVYVDFMYFADQMHKNDTVLLDNESIMLKVEIISATTLTCKIERGGYLGSYKDVFVPNVVFQMPNYSEKDKMYIDMAIHQQIDILIASFANSADAIMELKGLLGEKGKKIGIIANIQTNEGFRNFDEILEVTDGIMITRQELGSDITPKKLVIAQKNMIARANKANVPVSVSAHLLSSMRYKKIPLRAELLDIANCILDGTDCLVLSAETAVGDYPIETVACLATACKEAEACVWTKQIFHDFVDKTPIPCDQTTGASLAAALAAQRTIAAAIIVVTTSGKSAQIVAKYRPRCPIIAVTRYAPIARQLHMWRGVMPVVYEDSPDSNWQVDLEKRVNFCTKWAMEMGFIRVGDPVVIVSGWRQGSGFTNTMRVVYAAADTTNI